MAALGVLAGGMGALLGLGGGIFLIPFLVMGLHLPFQHAAGISLMTVIATSSAVSSGTPGAACSTCVSAWCWRSPPPSADWPAA